MLFLNKASTGKLSQKCYENLAQFRQKIDILTNPNTLPEAFLRSEKSCQANSKGSAADN